MEKGVLATRVWKYGPHKNAGVRMCVCVCVYVCVCVRAKYLWPRETIAPVVRVFRVFLLNETAA